MHLLCGKSSLDLLQISRRIFTRYGKGELKGQAVRRGSIGQVADLKGSNFKSFRGLDAVTVAELLHEVASGEKSLAEVGKECIKIKRLGEVQNTFLAETGVEDWEKAQERFPDFTTSEALDEYAADPKFQAKQLTPRLLP